MVLVLVEVPQRHSKTMLAPHLSEQSDALFLPPSIMCRRQLGGGVRPQLRVDEPVAFREIEVLGPEVPAKGLDQGALGSVQVCMAF